MTIANPPRGSGVGPAEIRLDAVLGNDTSAILQARYGQDGQPGYGGLRAVHSRWRRKVHPRTHSA